MIRMESDEDETPMMTKEKKHRSTLLQKTTSGSTGSLDEVIIVSMATSVHGHRSMSTKLTVLTLLVLISTLIFLMLFLAIPLFHGLSHPMKPMNGTYHEEFMARGHGHSSAHDESHEASMMDHESEHESDSMDPGMTKNMEAEQIASRNSIILKQISDLCPCVSTLTANSTHDLAEEMGRNKLRTAAENCLTQCFAKTTTSTEHGLHRP